MLPADFFAERMQVVPPTECTDFLLDSQHLFNYMFSVKQLTLIFLITVSELFEYRKKRFRGPGAHRPES